MMMMIRSSSTPILGSLLPSSSSFTLTDSPSCIHHPESCHPMLKPPSHLPSTNKHYSFHQPLSCTSSPISPSIADLDRQKKGLIRRVQSEGNLEDLAYTCYTKEDSSFDYAVDPPNPNRYSGRQRCLALETIPSFSLSKHTGLRQEEEDDVESEFEDENEEGEGVFSVLDSLSEDVKVKLNRVCSSVVYGEEIGSSSSSSKEMMYLAKGLGLDAGCRGGNNGGGNNHHNSRRSGGNDGDSNNNHHEVEQYYKNMVEQNPGNPLFLRNYAQFLYQCKEDREGAEEYYSRAILADPKDGDVLSQYGKLVWELHHDQERASSYFERAVQASPEDSHVHAAYASFLWDTEEDEDEDAGSCKEPQYLPSQFHHAATPTGV